VLKIMLKEPVSGTFSGSGDGVARSALFIEVDGIVDAELIGTLGDESISWLIFNVKGYKNRVVVPKSNISYIMEMS